MALDRRLVDTIKLNFVRKSNAQLEEVSRADGQNRWSPEAKVAAREVLEDRLAGRAEEPERPEADEEPPEFTYEPDEVALGVLGGLLTGFLVVPYYQRAVELDVPVPFGRRMAWLALDTTDTAAAAKAVGLRGAEEANWGAGVEAAHAGSVFVTPPVADWTLAVGTALFGSPEGFADGIKPRLEALSRRFGEVQFFCNHPDVGLYAWGLARQGRLVRGYGWLGARGLTLWDEGVPTREERDLGFRLATGQQPMVERADAPGVVPLTEDDVLALAAFWSIDPMTLDGDSWEPGTGLLGRIAAGGS